MQIGPFQIEQWHVLLLMSVALAAGWFLWGFLVPITGTWERVDEDVRAGTTERITLVQFGPFVRGRRMMPGGFQEYTGILRGRSILMTRRDHGREMICRQGFPDPIAEVIDGTVTAHLRMTLSADSQVLFGTFTPQKIEFMHEPPKVTARRFQASSFRRYRLISRTPVETELVTSEPKPESRPASDRVRRTV